MKTKFLFALLVVSIHSFAQNSNKSSPLDAISYGVVLEHPEMKNVIVKKDIAYLRGEKGSLNIDIYSPPNLKANDRKPAVIFLNAIGDDAGERKLKSWSIYTTWPQLMAAHGYIGISMESDGSRIQESIQGLFEFLENKGGSYNIDKDKLGVYAASANVSRSSVYLMSKEVSKGIKAAVLYYGRPAVGPFRKDLPVLFVIAEGDVNSGYNKLWSEVLKNNAPWTIKMGTGMPHAFDAVSDNDEARKVVKETISFWKNHLDPVLAPTWKYSKGRDVLGSLQMDHPKAISLLKSLTEEYPLNISTLLFYANELRQDQKFDEAGMVYNKVLAIEPKNVQALVAMAVLSYSQNKDEEGEAYISKAAQSGGIKRNDYARLGFYLLAANKNKEAALYYEKAIAMGADGFDYYYLARAYAKSNSKDRAFIALDNALKLGYGSKQQIENDGDFNSLRSDDRYTVLLEKTR